MPNQCVSGYVPHCNSIITSLMTCVVVASLVLYKLQFARLELLPESALAPPSVSKMQSLVQWLRHPPDEHADRIPQKKSCFEFELLKDVFKIFVACVRDKPVANEPRK